MGPFNISIGFDGLLGRTLPTTPATRQKKPKKFCRFGQASRRAIEKRGKSAKNVRLTRSLARMRNQKVDASVIRSVLSTLRKSRQEPATRVVNQPENARKNSRLPINADSGRAFEWAALAFAATVNNVWHHGLNEKDCTGDKTHPIIQSQIQVLTETQVSGDDRCKDVETH
jgi:hypothetical protein